MNLHNYSHNVFHWIYLIQNDIPSLLNHITQWIRRYIRTRQLSLQTLPLSTCNHLSLETQPHFKAPSDSQVVIRTTKPSYQCQVCEAPHIPPPPHQKLMLNYNGSYRANAISLNLCCYNWFLSYTLYFFTEILQIELKISISRFTSFQSIYLISI